MRARLTAFACALVCMCSLCLGHAGAITLGLGDQDETVYALNTRLYELGFLQETPGARYTQGTETAVREAQAFLSLDATGMADEDTRARLMQSETLETIAGMDARPGDVGPHVRRAQIRLSEIGLYHAALSGLYDGETERALEAFRMHMASRGMALESANGLDAHMRGALFGHLTGYGFAAPAFYDEIAPQDLTGAYLYAHAAIMTCGGDVLLENNADEPRAPASLTKMLTALAALETLTPDAQVTIADEAEWTPEDASLTPVYAGETMTVRDLLYAMLLPSGDDAAIALALAAQDSLDAFTARVNERARTLGMVNTRLLNADGYPQQGHVSTARDMALLLAAALEHPLVAEAMGTYAHELAPTEYRDAMTVYSTGAPLDPESQHYDARVTAVKTGYSSEAGYCAAVAASYGEQTLLCVVLGAPSDEARWLDVRRLLDAGFCGSIKRGE